MDSYGTEKDNNDVATECNDWGTIPPKREDPEPSSPDLSTQNTVKSKNYRVNKSPFMACLLSFLLVGLGQMYLGQVAKGIVMLIIAFILGALTSGGSFFIMVPIAMVDAYCIGKKMNKDIPVRKWDFF